MRSRIQLTFLTFAFLPVYALSHDSPPDTNSAVDSSPVLQSLLSEQLEATPNTEVIVSRVSLPPNTTLPKHWHPGEEFAFVINGEVTLWMKNRDSVKLVAGDAVKIPLKQIHTAITHEHSVDLVVFRVHEKGQPERVLAADE